MAQAYAPGQIIILNGTPRSGKSSIVAVIQDTFDGLWMNLGVDRFMQMTPQRYLPGIDLRQVKLESLRRQIGTVSQESLLFSVTLKENIRYGSRDANLNQIIQAAKNADMHEFILNLPQGYDTKIGEDGIKLSVGQKQRMSIARATLTDPRILIL